MSKDTHAAVEQAIQAHIADEMEDGLVIAWHVSLAVKTSADFDENLTRYPSIGPIEQPHHVSLGLLQTIVNDFNRPGINQ